MGNLLIEERKIVVPGEEVSDGMDYLPGDGTYRSEDKIVACRVGLFSLDGRLCKVIPLSGKYMPKEGDMVIARVVDIAPPGWKLDFGWPFLAVLTMREASREFIENGADLSKLYAIDEMVLAKVVKVGGSRSVELSMVAPGSRKLSGGLIVNCNTSKVPRIIGRQGSMINLIKDYTGCSIFVGQNGKVWIKGESPEKEFLASRTIKEIETKSHLPGLTDEITKFLEENK